MTNPTCPHCKGEIPSENKFDLAQVKSLAEFALEYRKISLSLAMGKMQQKKARLILHQGGIKFYKLMNKLKEKGI